jgi:HK97 family phage prohead protease
MLLTAERQAEARRRFGLKPTDEVHAKADANAVATVDQSQRLVTAIANTPSIDLDDEVVVPDGAERDDSGQVVYFGDMRAIYWAHNYDRPIGRLRTAALRSDRWVCQFYVTDKTAAGVEAFGLLVDGVVRGTSIGFVARDAGPLTEEERERYGIASSIVRRWTWLELSVTPMPCNPDAQITEVKAMPDDLCRTLAERITKGRSTREGAEALGMPTRRTIVLLGGG